MSFLSRRYAVDARELGIHGNGVERGIEYLVYDEGIEFDRLRPRGMKSHGHGRTIAIESLAPWLKISSFCR